MFDKIHSRLNILKIAQPIQNSKKSGKNVLKNPEQSRNFGTSPNIAKLSGKYDVDGLESLFINRLSYPKPRV